jgi:hypothetical protein
MAIGQTTPAWLEGAKFQASIYLAGAVEIWLAHSSAAGETIGWNAMMYWAPLPGEDVC